jgi:hypothetical protein
MHTLHTLLQYYGMCECSFTIHQSKTNIISCWYTDNYFSGGSRYKSEYDEALDMYVRKVVGTDVFDDLIKHEYTNWTLPQDTDQQPFRRGEVTPLIYCYEFDRLILKPIGLNRISGPGITLYCTTPEALL